MPTYDQLNDEAAWQDEYSAPALSMLRSRLLSWWPNAQIGIRGDNDHLRGYHRSRRWINESIYCTNRTYSVSRTAGDRAGGDSNWACAFDLGGIPSAELHAACKRLDTVIRAGRLEKITEWYGSFGDDDRVDGYDNISNRLATANSSHLWHLHMSFDRGRANEDHSDVFDVLTGKDYDMHVLVKSIDDDKIYRSDGQTRLWLQTAQDVADARYVARTGQTESLYHDGEILTVANLDVYGVEIGVPAPVTLTAEDRAAVVADLVTALTPLLGSNVVEAAVRKVMLDAGTP
jgi:hypothetical protein